MAANPLHIPRDRPYCGLTLAGWAVVGNLIAWGVVIALVRWLAS